MKFSGHDLSIVQNFVVKTEGRFKILEQTMSNFGDILNPFPVLVNYDSDINFKEVKNLYESKVENLYFQQGDNTDWVKDTLSLIEKTDSPYIGYLMEDSKFSSDFNSDMFLEMFGEFSKNKCEHLLMGKVAKYCREAEYSKLKSHHIWARTDKLNHDRLNHIRVFTSSYSPYITMSLVAIWKRELFVDCLQKTGSGIGLKAMDYFERANHFTNDKNIKCACPVLPYIDHNEAIDDVVYKER